MRLDTLIGERLGRYQIEALLGRGGMAAVYRAFDPALQRQVALKLLYPQFLADPLLVERFRREAITAAGLDHPHIAPIYDVGEADGIVYLAMKLLPGPSLAELLQREGRLPHARVVGLAAELASALDEAHREGIVHRDIKPGNVLFDRHGRAILTDFGIAKSLESSALTETSVLVGTPDYIAPEQIDHELAVGGKVDGRADIYAFGALLYRALTGHRPFEGTAQAVFLAHLRDEPRPATVLAPDLPQAVDAVLARAMAKRPEARYATAGDVARALEDTLGEATVIGSFFPAIAPRGEPYTPTPPVEPVARSVVVEAPRHRRAWRAVALLALLLTLAGSGMVLRQITNSRFSDGKQALASVDAGMIVPDVAITDTATSTPTATTTTEPPVTPSATGDPTGSPTELVSATMMPAPSAPTATTRPGLSQQVVAESQPGPLVQPKAMSPILPLPSEEPVTATSSPSPTSTSTPSPTATAEPTATPEPPTPTATATPEPVVCTNPPVSGFGTLWSRERSVQAQLGCPVQPEQSNPVVEQVFENGLMYWWGPSQQIFVLTGEGSGMWSAFPNTYTDGADQTPLTPPLGGYAPERGFGEVWRNYPAVSDALGWGRAPELPLMGVYQRFEHGIMLYSWQLNGHPRQIYVLFNNGSFVTYPDTE